MIRHIIGNRPPEFPEGWPVYNAPRPLFGPVQRSYESFHGIFYVALDPSDTATEGYKKANAALDAWQVSWISEQAAVEEEYQRQQARLDFDLDIGQSEHYEWLLDTFRERQRG